MGFTTHFRVRGEHYFTSSSSSSSSSSKPAATATAACRVRACVRVCVRVCCFLTLHHLGLVRSAICSLCVPPGTAFWRKF